MVPLARCSRTASSVRSSVSEYHVPSGYTTHVGPYSQWSRHPDFGPEHLRCFVLELHASTNASIPCCLWACTKALLPSPDARDRKQMRDAENQALFCPLGPLSCLHLKLIDGCCEVDVQLGDALPIVRIGFNDRIPPTKMKLRMVLLYLAQFAYSIDEGLCAEGNQERRTLA